MKSKQVLNFSIQQVNEEIHENLTDKTPQRPSAIYCSLIESVMKYFPRTHWNFYKL